MTIFKTYLRILNRYKFIVFIYAAILILISVLSLQTSSSSTTFESITPNITIFNSDDNQGITKSLIDYLTKNGKIIELENTETAISDALFYHATSLVIYIPEGFHQDFLTGKSPEIRIQSAKDYNSALAEMILARFLETANLYRTVDQDETVLIQDIESALATPVSVETASQLDAHSLAKATSFYNFLNYAVLAGNIYIICIIMLSFRSENIRKRTIISSTSYKSINRQLFLANIALSFVLWLCYVVISIIIVGPATIFSSHGLIYILNSFVFTICATALAFLLTSIITNKNAINGIVNVVAIGSSFLCGAFVPAVLLPDFVLNIARVLPSYWYINANNRLASLANLSLESLTPIFLDILAVLGFSALFIILANLIAKRQRKLRDV